MQRHDYVLFCPAQKPSLTHGTGKKKKKNCTFTELFLLGFIYTPKE